MNCRDNDDRTQTALGSVSGDRSSSSQGRENIKKDGAVEDIIRFTSFTNTYISELLVVWYLKNGRSFPELLPN